MLLEATWTNQNIHGPTLPTSQIRMAVTVGHLILNEPNRLQRGTTPLTDSVLSTLHKSSKSILTMNSLGTILRAKEITVLTLVQGPIPTLPTTYPLQPHILRDAISITLITDINLEIRTII
jgi:hypothetical protein